MNTKPENLNLLDLVGLDFLQQFQDNFAEALSVASMIIDDNGPITKSSNFNKLCSDEVRKIELGALRCGEIDIGEGKLALAKDEPLIYKCPSGLINFAVPIFVDGKHIASFLGGQILPDNLDEEKLRTYAKELGIENDAEFINNLKKIKILSEEKFDAAVYLLHFVANSISEIANKNFILMRKYKKESLIAAVIEQIRSSLDINETKKAIVDVIGKTLNADRCFIMEYDKQRDKFLFFEEEYLPSPEMLSYINVDLNITIPKFVSEFKKGKSLILNSKKALLGDEIINLDDGTFDAEKIAIEDYKVYSAVVFPIFYLDDFLGSLVVQFIDEEHEAGDDELETMKLLASQIGIALHQSKLYNDLKIKSERELLLREIINKIRASLDFNQTKKAIVEVIGKIMHADGCCITEYDQLSEKFLVIKDEYLSSDKIKSFEGIHLNEYIKGFAEAMKNDQPILINNGKLMPEHPTEGFDSDMDIIHSHNINSSYICPLFYQEELIGAFLIYYVKEKHIISEDELAFLNLLTNQIGIALYQSKLYNRIQLQAERERISKNIIEILRSSIDKSIIKKLFVRNIGKFFNANRVLYSEYDEKRGIYLPVDNKSQYLSSNEEISFIGYDWTNPDAAEYIQPLLEKREIHIFDLDKYLAKNPKGEGFIRFSKYSNVKSSYSFPVMYSDKMIGYFSIEFTHKVTILSEEAISRIRSICSQAGVALHHAALYLKTQDVLQSKRELITQVRTQIKEPVDNIIKSSNLLSEMVEEHSKLSEHLNSIVNSCNELLELTKDISEYFDDDSIL